MYGSAEEVSAGFRTLDADEKERAETLLNEATLMIDATGTSATEAIKSLAACRMVRRALGDGGALGVPIGASQSTVSALGYSQSWTLAGSGTTGELYIGKTEKKLLGLSSRIGAHSPLEDM